MLIPRHFVFFVAALIALGPFAIDTYLPALPAMAIDFGVDIVAINYTVSVYLFGFALGQIVGGPISDQIGRKPVGLTGLVIFSLASLGIVWVEAIDGLLVLRMIQAIGGGFATVICMAMVRDAYPADQAALQFPKVMLVMLSAPLVAPAIGAGLLALGWSSIFVFLSAYGLLMITAFGTVPETAQHRTGRLQPRDILPQYIAVLRSRVDGRLIALRWIVAQGMMSSLLFVFITNSPFIYLEYYDVEPHFFVFFFAANVLAMMLGSSLATRLIRTTSPFVLYNYGRAVQYVGVVTLLVITASTSISIVYFVGLLALSIGCGGLINPSVQGMYLRPFTRLSGSATSLMNMSVFSFGAAWGAISGYFYNGTLLPVVATMLTALTLSNLIGMSIPRPAFNPGDQA